MNMEIQYYNKIRWGLAPLAPNDAPPLVYEVNRLCTSFGLRRSLWHLMAPRFVIKIICNAIFDNLIKLMSSFLSQRKLGVSVEGEISTPLDIKAGVPQVVPVPHTIQLIHNDTLQTISVHLALFADDASLYARERIEGYVLRKLQPLLNSMTAWCSRN
jgi:hypothetical protein